jgi:hypothetical protein
LRKTVEGKVEERLPALFIMVPPSLLEMFPEAHYFMKANQHKLVTVFDLHKTLKHLMMLPDSYHSMWTRPNTYRFNSERFTTQLLTVYLESWFQTIELAKM